MNERLFFLLYKLPSGLVVTLVIATSLLLVLFIQGCFKAAGARPQNTNTSAELAHLYSSSSPNAVTAGMDELGHGLEEGTKRALKIAGGGLGHVASSTVQGGKVLAAGVQATGRGIGKGIRSEVNTTAGAVVAVLKIPVNLFGFISDSQAVNAIIEPADRSTVPIIDPNDPELLAALQALPADKPASQMTGSVRQEAVWPMQGQITTHFGEKGRYYRTVHTGIDISDGQPSGVTPVRAFRPGTVIVADRDRGLGNRVIVDHGSGITSVYGHLSFISVQPGQQVDTSTTLGLQGSTGVSTGPHLHFEIRVNDQAADPRLFIAGKP